MAVSYIVGILPPSNIEKDVSVIQNRIFERWGNPSSLALPVFIPVAAPLKEKDTKSAVQVIQGLKRGFTIEIADFTVINKTFIYLNVGSGGNWAYLRNKILSLAPTC